MSRRLNLGCGTFPFPLVRGQEPVAIVDHVVPVPDTVYEPGWINVDKFPMPGVQEVINLFRFPWIRSSNGSPFNDDSIEEIWAAHLIEHIPHEVKLSHDLPPLIKAEWRDIIDNYDGFFVFFKEVYRILKPDGLIHMRFPYAVNYPSLCDPTHTRYITMGTFGYLNPQEDGDPFDYNVGINFQLVGKVLMRFTEDWNQEREYLSEKGIGRMLRDSYSCVDQISVTLRAVK